MFILDSLILIKTWKSACYFDISIYKVFAGYGLEVLWIQQAVLVCCLYRTLIILRPVYIFTGIW